MCFVSWMALSSTCSPIPSSRQQMGACMPGHARPALGGVLGSPQEVKLNLDAGLHIRCLLRQPQLGST